MYYWMSFLEDERSKSVNIIENTKSLGFNSLKWLKLSLNRLQSNGR